MGAICLIVLRQTLLHGTVLCLVFVIDPVGRLVECHESECASTEILQQALTSTLNISVKQ